MTTDGSYMRDAEAKLEEARHSLMTQVMKVQVLDAEELTGAGESCTDRVR